MYRKNTKNALTIVLVLLCSAFTFGQGDKSEAGGPPSKEELIGFWKKKNVDQLDNINQENPWPQKYQWFAFNENGKIYSLMSDQDYNYTSKELSEIFGVFPNERVPNYVLDGLMLTVDNPDIANYQEVWGVNLFAKDINEFLMKGNLIMSLDDGNGNAIYYRLLEKIQ